MNEFDNIQDPAERLRYVNRLGGVSDQAAAQELYLRSTGQATRAEYGEAEQAVHTVTEFLGRHSDPVTQSLKPAAAKLLESNDPRLRGCTTSAEMLDKAFAIAWWDKNPSAKAARGVTSRLEERDNARSAAKYARKIDKAIG